MGYRIIKRETVGARGGRVVRWYIQRDQDGAVLCRLTRGHARMTLERLASRGERSSDTWVQL
jgi:hypothetical protein